MAINIINPSAPIPVRPIETPKVDNSNVLALLAQLGQNLGGLGSQAAAEARDEKSMRLRAALEDQLGQRSDARRLAGDKEMQALRQQDALTQLETASRLNSTMGQLSTNVKEFARQNDMQGADFEQQLQAYNNFTINKKDSEFQRELGNKITTIKQLNSTINDTKAENYLKDSTSAQMAGVQQARLATTLLKMYKSGNLSLEKWNKLVKDEGDKATSLALNSATARADLMRKGAEGVRNATALASSDPVLAKLLSTSAASAVPSPDDVSKLGGMSAKVAAQQAADIKRANSEPMVPIDGSRPWGPDQYTQIDQRVGRLISGLDGQERQVAKTFIQMGLTGGQYQGQDGKWYNANTQDPAEFSQTAFNGQDIPNDVKAHVRSYLLGGLDHNSKAEGTTPGDKKLEAEGKVAPSAGYTDDQFGTNLRMLDRTILTAGLKNVGNVPTDADQKAAYAHLHQENMARAVRVATQTGLDLPSAYAQASLLVPLQGTIQQALILGPDKLPPETAAIFDQIKTLKPEYKDLLMQGAYQQVIDGLGSEVSALESGIEQKANTLNPQAAEPTADELAREANKIAAISETSLAPSAILNGGFAGMAKTVADQLGVSYDKVVAPAPSLPDAGRPSDSKNALPFDFESVIQGVDAATPVETPPASQPVRPVSFRAVDTEDSNRILKDVALSRPSNDLGYNPYGYLDAFAGVNKTYRAAAQQAQQQQQHLQSIDQAAQQNVAYANQVAQQQAMAMQANQKGAGKSKTQTPAGQAPQAPPMATVAPPPAASSPALGNLALGQFGQLPQPATA